MTVRDELECVLGMRRKYDASETALNWDVFASASYRFLRDHGPALLAMVADSERYRWLRTCHEAQIGERHATVVMWADEPWEPEDGVILDEAIDRAREGV